MREPFEPTQFSQLTRWLRGCAMLALPVVTRCRNSPGASVDGSDPRSGPTCGVVGRRPVAGPEDPAAARRERDGARRTGVWFTPFARFPAFPLCRFRPSESRTALLASGVVTAPLKIQPRPFRLPLGSPPDSIRLSPSRSVTSWARRPGNSVFTSSKDPA